MIDNLTIIGGYDKTGRSEPVNKIEINKGEITGIVGLTGSGKSCLIEDIEQMARQDTPSGRKILLNRTEPDEEIRTNPKKKLVAQLSQNMNFLANMSVEDFLRLHAKCRGKNINLVDEVIRKANTLTGEPIKKDNNLTILSGGQSRALMVADVAFISNSPIVLVDEIENAGIKKHEALKLLSGNGKIILVVTHDPVLALATTKRIVMKDGGMQKIIETTELEKIILNQLSDIDAKLMDIREKVRFGEEISERIFINAPQVQSLAYTN